MQWTPKWPAEYFEPLKSEGKQNDGWKIKTQLCLILGKARQIYLLYFIPKGNSMHFTDYR